MARIQRRQRAGVAANRPLDLNLVHFAGECEYAKSYKGGRHGHFWSGFRRNGDFAEPQETGTQPGLPVGAAPSGLLARREPAMRKAAIGLMLNQHHVEFWKQVNVSEKPHPADPVIPSIECADHGFGGDL